MPDGPRGNGSLGVWLLEQAGLDDLTILDKTARIHRDLRPSAGLRLELNDNRMRDAGLVALSPAVPVAAAAAEQHHQHDDQNDHFCAHGFPPLEYRTLYLRRADPRVTERAGGVPE